MEEIAAFVADIDGLDAQIELLEKQKSERLEALAIAAREAYAKRSVEAVNAMFNKLYWSLMSLPPSSLAKAFGRHLNSFKIEPIWTGIRCMACDKELAADSRTRLYHIHALARDGACLCQPCQQSRNGRTPDNKAEWWRRQNELRSMPYGEYLRTPEWQDTRKRAVARAAWRCQLCNVSGNDEGIVLQVHHRTYENRGRELAGDLTVLCKPCHGRHHRHFSAEAPP
jgi:hypothetical protein